MRAWRRFFIVMGGIAILLPQIARAADPRPEPFRHRLTGLWLMGQSLCDGSESLPLVTTAPSPWGSLMFKRGVRTWVYGDHHLKPADRPANQFSFAPLMPAANGALGETMANGLADHLENSLSGARLAKANASAFLVAYAGQGGRTIGELSSADEATDPRTPEVKRQGGGYYQTSLDDARRVVKQAHVQGSDFGIAALVWMQGEANGGPTGGIVPHRWEVEIKPPTGQEWYRDQLIAYHKQWSEDLCKITGQRGDIPMFTYQTLGPAGEAQLMASDLDPHLYMVGPHYMVPSAVNSRRNGLHGAAIHLAADGERWYGEQVAKVMRRVLAEGEAWQPLRPKKAVVEPGRGSVLVEMIVPRPPLVIDEKFLPRQESGTKGGFTSLDGFRVSDAKGGVALLTAVEVESPTRLRLRLAAPLTEGAKCFLSYGLPHAGEIGVVASLRAGENLEGQPTMELLLTGDLRERLKSLSDEGAFYVANTASGGGFAQTIVRTVKFEDGSTVLRFENRDLRNNVPFAAGQTLTALRPFSYGNVRDSDAESSVYRFGDATYGGRAGQAYPLWNWCVLFSGVSVEEK